jgi:hypothetical protein
MLMSQMIEGGFFNTYVSPVTFVCASACSPARALAWQLHKICAKRISIWHRRRYWQMHDEVGLKENARWQAGALTWRSTRDERRK